MNAKIEESYEIARERYSQLGVDTGLALGKLGEKSLSIHCWQGDDVGGFETPDATLSGGGIEVTGSYPGKARNVDELRRDLEKALSLIPCKHRVNLHAMYGDYNWERVDRDKIMPSHFDIWIEWARSQNVGIDFNATLFSHPRASSGFTLSSKDSSVRDFWIEHVKRCREISAYIGQKLGSPCVHNLWIPDGMKDFCVDRGGYREILRKSLDEIYSIKYDPSYMKDAVEPKLFGIGSESYVTGSYDFYLAYALSHDFMICLDLGHFHPTESVADKISSILPFSHEMLLHVSRGVRWDSDHVVVLDDQVQGITHEIVRNNALDRVHIALDYFDASINRVGAWVTGARATMKALLFALLEPTETLVKFEEEGNYFARLALLEELKTMPFGAVWDYHCLENSVPVGEAWIHDVLQYEKEVLSKRV